jgi:hypothetical protein
MISFLLIFSSLSLSLSLSLSATTSPKFEEFLSFLGEKIELKGFTGYNGGLDVHSNLSNNIPFFLLKTIN